MVDDRRRSRPNKGPAEKPVLLRGSRGEFRLRFTSERSMQAAGIDPRDDRKLR